MNDVSPKLPQQRDSVCLQARVARNERHSFYLRLSDEQAVEWIAMVKRESEQFPIMS